MITTIFLLHPTHDSLKKHQFIDKSPSSIRGILRYSSSSRNELRCLINFAIMRIWQTFCSHRNVLLQDVASPPPVVDMYRYSRYSFKYRSLCSWHSGSPCISDKIFKEASTSLPMEVLWEMRLWSPWTKVFLNNNFKSRWAFTLTFLHFLTLEPPTIYQMRTLSLNIRKNSCW